MQNVKTIYKKSVRQYKENISVLQSINIVYITIIFLLFVTGIYLLGIWALTALYSLACDVNAEKRRERQEKRDVEYHKARMKELMK